MRNLSPGATLGRFRIVSVLGEGAMGVVYLAEDPEIERRVAIKTLRALSEASPDAVAELEARFLKEAKLAGRLQHPNVVTVYEVGRDGGTAFIAMEYVDGESLTRIAPSLETAARVEVLRQVAQALQHAHARGVLHRDIKPGNILVTRDRRVKVADFGIGKLLTGGTADLTRTGQMLGSPAYMSPEQIRGEKLDGRSDLFSLGVVAYELLTGSRPFPGDSITTLVYQILHTEPRDPLELKSDLPTATRGVFARLLAKAPDRRPADAAEFLAELAKIEKELSDVEPTQAFPVARLATAARPPDRSAFRAREPAATPPPAEPPQLKKARPTSPTRIAAPTRRVGPAYLFGAAGLLAALALLLWVWRGPERRGEPMAAAVPSPASGASFGSAAPPATALPAAAATVPAPPSPEPTAEMLPTRGPSAAADAIVGATRLGGTPARPVRTRAVPTAASPAAPASPPPAAVVASNGAAADRPPASSVESAADNVYRARRFAKFSASPEQARVYLDDRYVGIVDDWDNHGGGRTLPLGSTGRHRVRLELPGYRSLQLDFLVSPDAGDDTVDVDEELKRQSKVDYPKLKSPFDRTEGPVVFEVTPADAVVSENGKALGPVSAFGPASPLRLSGPSVHDLQITAPGYEPRDIRILVSSNADRDKAAVRFALKPEKS